MAVASLFRDTPQWWSYSVKVQPPMIHPWFFWGQIPTNATLKILLIHRADFLSFPVWTSLGNVALGLSHGLPNDLLLRGASEKSLSLGVSGIVWCCSEKTSTKFCCCFAGFHKNHRMLFNYSSWVAMGRCHRSTSTILIDTTTDEHSDSAGCFKGILTDLQDSMIRQSHFEGLDRLVDSSEAGNGRIV